MKNLFLPLVLILSVVPNFGAPQAAEYTIDPEINRARAEKGLPTLVGTAVFDVPVLDKECAAGIKWSCDASKRISEMCFQRCEQQYPQESIISLGVGPWIDCIEACQGRSGNYERRESENRQIRENRNSESRERHNQKCLDEYNARLAGGGDKIDAAISYSRCVQY